MSNSYIVELERLRALLEDILDEKGISVTSGEVLSSLIPKVNNVGLDAFASMWAGTSTEIVDSTGAITSITNQACRYAPYISKLIVPSCTSISTYAFYNNTLMTEADLSGCAIVNEYAFQGCTALEKVTFANSVDVRRECFKGTKIKELKVQNMTAVAASFGECTSLQKIEISGTLNISDFGSNGYGVFRGCTALETAKIHTWSRNGTTAGDFSGCSALKKVEIGGGTTIATRQLFNGCQNLKLVDLGTMAAINGSDNNTFTNCDALEAVVLRKMDSITTLASSAIFNYPVSNNPDFYIYVPKKLYDTYYNASNWSNVSGNLVETELNLSILVPLGFDYSDIVEIVNAVPASPTKWKVYWIEKSRTAEDITYAQWFADDDGEGGVYVYDIEDDITIPIGE